MAVSNLLFLGKNASGQTVLLSTDGTTVTTVATDTGTSSFKADTFATNLLGAVIGSTAYLDLTDQTGQTNAIYSYNGTTAQQITSSSYYVNDIVDSNAATSSGSATPITTYNGNLVFSQAPVTDTDNGAFDHATLAIYNPTTGTISQPSVPNVGYDPQDFVTLNGTLYFEAKDTATNALAIYSYNGTTVSEVYNLHPTTTAPGYTAPAAGAVQGPLVAFNGNLYFGSGQESIYELNSTAANSNSATNRSGGSGYAFNGFTDNNLIVAGNHLFFVNSNNGVYSLDTSNNLSQVVGSIGSQSLAGVAYNNQLYFTAYSVNGQNLQPNFYSSTGSGATVIKSNVSYSNFQVLGSNLYFTDGSTGLGKYDGTTFTTLNTGGDGGNPGLVVPFAATSFTVGTVTPPPPTPNHAPAGTDKTVTTNEDTGYTFAAADFGFTDPNDTPANSLKAVEITTLPAAGMLTDNSVAVTSGQFVSATDISGGKLVFTPASNANGTGYSSFTFQVQDDGGTANSGVDTDQSPNTITVNVTSVNDAPAGTDGSVTTLEDTAYTFKASDFGFTDPNDSPANNFNAMRIVTVPAAGTLTYDGVAFTSPNFFVTVANINAGFFEFIPAANANGTGYASFTFQVQDNGGVANGGQNLDQSPNTLTINVTSVNDAPAGTDKKVTTLEDTAYTFAASDFGFTDPNDSPANTLQAVEITTLPSAGTLTDNGTAVTAGQFVSATDISGGKLAFTPAANANGTGYSSFTFQVQDNGGTANSGIDTDQSPNTITVNVTSVNDAPAGADKTVTTLEDTAYTFAASDFGFSDPNDTPANTLQAVEITTLPTAGTLTDNGTAVTAGQFVSATDISGGKLAFTPAANANGTGYSSFTFQVQDNGGTANGGVDTDQSPNTITVNVTSVNDAPAGADKTVTTLEDTAYTFAASDFGFSDPNDTPPNQLAAVVIKTLPSAGTLTDSGFAVAAGQFVLVANINGGKFLYTPAANANGTGYASFTFQVEDNGGTANGGVDTDQSPNTITVNVTSVNDAPAGTDKTVVTLEDTAYTLTVADFGFSDPNDTPANTFLAVEISALPTGGTLTDNGVAVTAGQFIQVADISANKLVFAPAANINGNGAASFTFQVQDNGGTANTGVDTDQSPNKITFNITPVNDAPAGTDGVVTTLEDTAYTFAASDFGFTDPNDSPPNALLTVKIDTLPAAGTLTDNGVAVAAGQVVSVVDITGGKLVFTPVANANGGNYASFTFQVQDDGGTANGGVDLDQSPNKLTVNVIPVNDPPAGTDKTITAIEDKLYTFTIGDFDQYAMADLGFSDPNDNPPNALLAVKITTLPTLGTLTDNGVAVTAGQFVSAADIGNGLLKYVAAANANGTGYSSFTFQVQDNGGTANGGVDLDQSPNTITIDVTPVNDAPAGTDKTVTALEDTPYTVTAADFGFSDPNDNPPNTLQTVKIVTSPAVGTLTDNGAALVSGQYVSAADIVAGKLVYTPVANASGTGYASFTFLVEDNGGTANGGIDTDQNPNTITFNVLSVNDAPAGADKTVTTGQRAPYTFAVADFGFTDASDTPANTLQAVKITTLPTAGALTDNGVTLTAGQFVSAADIASGLLKFTPTTNVAGTGYASFTFQVQDNGGTANGGVDTDQSPNTITVNVSPAPLHDVNADGTSDVLLQSGSTVVDWIVKNGAYQSGAVLANSSGYNVVGSGDFNGDGTADVLLQNGSSVVDWLLQNGTYQSSNALANSSGYKVVGTGDFNRDGTTDVLLQSGNSVVDWIIQNGAYQSGNTLANSSGYTVVGTGDFNGDGTTDVLLQNGNSVVDWTIKNGAYQSGNVLGNSSGYQVVGTGDFNGDGTTDVLLQNGSSVIDWLLINGAYQSGNFVANSSGYQVVGTGDYNADGTTDILLQNGSSVVQWTMQNGALQSSAPLANSSGFAVKV